ncbi:SRPBCC family protein [Thalassotalea euphylliae]|uniref:SRPBCC family protein n=1 Tax=Thalassotalea euphylliae TaxID=1655234 RepID=UPI0036263281
MIKIDLEQQVNASPAELLALLTDHVNLSRFFNAEFAIAKSSFEGEIPGGKGCRRLVDTLGQSFVEEITKADISGIEYRIVGSQPLKHHFGQIDFTVLEQQTLINYYVEGVPVSYLPKIIVQWAIERDIRQALRKIAQHFTHEEQKKWYDKLLLR